MTTLETVLADPSTSYWLRDALTAAMKRDPVDAFKDATALLELVRARADSTLHAALRDIGGTRIPDAPPALKSRWKCPDCGSENVRVSLPTWYREQVPVGYQYPASDLTFVETDEDADISWWYCDDCSETDSGQPEENT